MRTAKKGLIPIVDNQFITLTGGKVQIIETQPASAIGKHNTCRYYLIICPTCHKQRWVPSSHLKSTFTGLCRHCSNLIQIRHALPQKANNIKSYGEPNRLWKKKTPILSDDARFHHSKDHNLQVSQKLLGHTKSPETRARMAERTKQLWQDPEYRRKHLEALMGTQERKDAWQKAARAGQKKHPNRNETRIQGYLDRLFPKQYKFVGDDPSYQTAGLFPDHINIDGKKKIILAHGTHWHADDDIRKVIQQYANAGYDCLLMWEHENKDASLSESKLNEFHNLPEGNIDKCVELSTIKLPRPRWS